LLEGEKLLAKCENLYATDKRLIRYIQHQGMEELEELTYSKITSLYFNIKPRYDLMTSGGSLMLVGAIVLGIGIVIPIVGSILVWLGSLVGISGVIILIAGILSKVGHWQIKAPDIDKDRWKITKPSTDSAKQFIRVVRELWLKEH